MMSTKDKRVSFSLTEEGEGKEEGGEGGGDAPGTLLLQPPTAAGSPPTSPEPGGTVFDSTPSEPLPSSLRSSKVRVVRCNDCGLDIPEADWPNHRDRLRTVQTNEQFSKFQRALISTVVESFMWLIMNVYFREVAVVGLPNVPKKGPVVFYGNHQNQFIDAMMIRAHCGRPVRFIVAEKSMHRPVVGQFARLMQSVPVVRPQDVPSVVGGGVLILVEGSRVVGKGTTFGESLTHGDVISWNAPGNRKCVGQVVTIVNNEELLLSLAVKPEESISAPTPYKFSRRIDHSDMYAAVYDTLAKGECIGIFPEGGSHDHTSLQPLKAGVALFTLGAAARGIYPTIIPCGLTYFYGHRFRSRAHIEFGPPITPSLDLVQDFETDKRKATGELLTELQNKLRAVTINVPDWVTLNFLHAFRSLYQPAHFVMDTGDYLSLMRRLSRIIAQHRAEPQLVAFREEVEDYCDFMNALSVRDSQAATLQSLDTHGIGYLLARRMLMLVVMGVILTPFFVIGAPIGIATQLAADAHARTALATSKVKVVAADVKGSYKLITGFILFPLMICAVGMGTFWMADLRVALTVSFSLPMAMYVSLLIVREFLLELKAVLPLVISILSKHKQFRKLYERRRRLVNEARQVVARFDPTLNDEMDDLRQRAPAAAKKPSLFSLRHVSQLSDNKRM